MKGKIKVIGMIAIIIVMIFTITAFATVGSRTVELWYNNINIVLNGKEVIPTDANGNTVEPFTIDGTTYLPVRGIASALGLNVGWNAETSTVTLDNPGVFSGAVQVYDDEFVTIEFAGCRQGTGYDSDEYFADFNIKNKTDAELTFDIDAIALDGISYQISDMEEVAPQSTGKISFCAYDTVLPISGVSKTSGKIRVIDMDRALTDWDYDYDAKWVDVTNK